MIAFEIQVFKEGAWKVDSVFDDRELALFEAKKIDEGTRYSGVQVVEEKYDEASGRTKTRTLYRGGATKTGKPKAQKEAPASKRPAQRRGTGKEATRKGKAKPKAKKTSLVVPLILLMVLLIALAGGLLALQYLK